MTFNVDNLLLFYLVLGVYGVFLAVVAVFAALRRDHKQPKNRSQYRA